MKWHLKKGRPHASETLIWAFFESAARAASSCSGFDPAIKLSYDSSSGNGPLGFGWSLGTPTITRKTDKGIPQYRDGDESDVFVLAGADGFDQCIVDGMTAQLAHDPVGAHAGSATMHDAFGKARIGQPPFPLDISTQPSSLPGKGFIPKCC